MAVKWIEVQHKSLLLCTSVKCSVSEEIQICRAAHWSAGKHKCISGTRITDTFTTEKLSMNCSARVNFWIASDFIWMQKCSALHLSHVPPLLLLSTSLLQIIWHSTAFQHAHCTLHIAQIMEITMTQIPIVIKVCFFFKLYLSILSTSLVYWEAKS